MSKILENEQDYSQKVTERMIELINQNKLNYSDDLKILKLLVQKYEVISIQDFANKQGKSYNGILDMIKRDKVATIEISGKTYVFNKLN